MGTYLTVSWTFLAAPNLCDHATLLLLRQHGPDIYTRVAECRNYIVKRIAHRRIHRDLKLFPTDGPLEYIAIEILGPLHRTAAGF